MGRVRKAFGLKGELLVQPITNEPGAVFASGRRVFANRASYDIESSRPFKDAWLVKIVGVNDKTAADLWHGRELLAEASTLAPPDENEVYLDELAGMTVRDEPHGVLGDVAGWYQLPQGIVLEVRGPQWRADIPFNEAFVRNVDRAARCIDVHLPDGLVEPVA